MRGDAQQTPRCETSDAQQRKCSGARTQDNRPTLSRLKGYCPVSVIASLEVAINRRQSQSLWYTSTLNSDTESNASHQWFINSLIEVGKTLTGRPWCYASAVILPEDNVNVRSSTRASVVNSVTSKGDILLQGSNRYAALSRLDVVTIETGWPCLSALYDAEHNLLDLLAEPSREERTVDEVVICMNQGVLHTQLLGAELHAMDARLHAVGDIEDVTVLKKLEAFMGIRPKTTENGTPSLSSRSHNLEGQMLEALREYVSDLEHPILQNDEQFRSFLSLDAFYAEAQIAVRNKRVHLSFLWVWEPYFTMRKLLSHPSCPFVPTTLAHTLALEESLVSSLTATGENTDRSRQSASIAHAITTAQQLRLITTALGGSVHKYVVSVCLQSFSAMMHRHLAGLIHCSERGDVGLLSHLYVGLQVHIPPLTPKNRLNSLALRHLEDLNTASGTNEHVRVWTGRAFLESLIAVK